MKSGRTDVIVFNATPPAYPPELWKETYHLDFIRKITKRQWILIAYLPIHLIWYLIGEQVNVSDYTVLHCALDDLIPFCEWFIFAYLSWFLYMVGAGVYFLLKDHEAFERYLLSLFIGFFFSMLIVTLFPTGQELRPNITGDENFATWIVSLIYGFDTNTNIFPSMHVVGAVAVVWNVWKSRTLHGKKALQVCNWLLCVLICAATVFLKQHSALDILGALIIEIPVLIFVFSGVPSRWLSKLTKTASPLLDK